MMAKSAIASVMMGLAGLAAAQPTLMPPSAAVTVPPQAQPPAVATPGEVLPPGLTTAAANFPDTAAAVVDQFQLQQEQLVGVLDAATVPEPGLATVIPTDEDLSNVPMLMASGGTGNWNFDYSYLGCPNQQWSSCTSPVLDRYSPEGNGYLKSTGGQITVRLWYPMVDTNYDLYIEKYVSGAWKVVYTGAVQSSWQKRAVFQTLAGESYRFRAYRRSGAGYYTMSWKYDNSGPAIAAL